MSFNNEDPKNESDGWVMTYRENGKRWWTRIGMYHQSMLGRARKGGWVQTFHPSYDGVEVSKDFQDFQRFGDWCVAQAGWGLGYHLDKDLLQQGNRVYCADHCVFLPQAINAGIVRQTTRTARGELPGTYRRQGRKNWTANALIGGKTTHLGVFPTEQEAHEVYCGFKEAWVKELANQYRDTIDPRAYAALMTWTVSRSVQCQQ